MFCEDIPCVNINRLQFIKAFIYTDLYRRLSGDKNIITVEEILKNIDHYYDLSIPSLSGNYRTGTKILRRLPNDMEVDIILFNSIFSLSSYISGNGLLINYDIHKLVNENYGMKDMPSKIYQKIYSINDSQDMLKIIGNVFKTQGIVAQKKRHCTN